MPSAVLGMCQGGPSRKLPTSPGCLWLHAAALICAERRQHQQFCKPRPSAARLPPLLQPALLSALPADGTALQQRAFGSLFQVGRSRV